MFGEIRNEKGERLDYRWHPAGPGTGPHPVVLLGHGVTAHLDRPFVQALAEGMAAAGISALRFSFSGNGASEGRFEDSCITKEVADLGSVIDAVTAAGYDVSYAGHSMGGAVGILRAAADPRIRHLICLAAMIHTGRFVESEFGEATPDQGFMWDDPACPLSSTFVRDLKGIESVAPKIAEVRVPVLFVYGIEDDLVPGEEGREVFSKANEPKELVELRGSNHVFAGPATQEMVTAVVSWLQRQFSAQAIDGHSAEAPQALES